MASSGTYNFSVSNGEAVLAAYERIKIFAPSLRQEHMASARRELNFLLAYASNQQVNLWKVVLNTVTLVSGQATYTVPPQTVMVLDAWVTVNNSSPTSASDLYITPISRTEYASFANKQTTGRPTSYWYDRTIAQTITMWPVPDANGPYTLNYYSCVQVQDANLTGGETPDIPYLWLDWFVAGLSHRFARIYATTEVEKLRKADADEAWTIAATQNVENTPLSLSPTISTFYRR